MPLSRVWREATACAGILLIVAGVPLVGRFAARGSGDLAATTPSYLPSLETARVRLPFDPGHIEGLRHMQPGLVVIGDSMAGRIDERHLTATAATPVAPILYNASGPASWYLTLKNSVAASGVKPDWVVIFFRDTNLTDVAFRLDGPYRASLDVVAREHEPELDAVVARRNAGVWAGAHRLLERIYRVSALRAWFEPVTVTWPARAVAVPGRETAFLERVNAAFTLDRLRPMAVADLAQADDRLADFDAYVDRSVLPLMLDTAARAGLRLCFVRVMRRPVNGQPPPVSPALQRYMGRLRAYVETRGAALLDDHDDPSLAALAYADGDHIARASRVPYTDRFLTRLAAVER